METEIKKSNGGLIVLIIILIIAVLGLGGYVIYDKSLNNNKQSDVKDVKEETLTMQEALPLGNDLYNLANDIFWGNGVKISDDTSTIEADNGNVINGAQEITNYKEISSHYTKSYLQNNIDSLVSGTIYKNGTLYMVAGRGGNVSYMSTKLSSTDINTDKITYNAVSTYCDDADYSLGDDSCNKTSTKTEKFVIVKVNGTWLIDSFTIPN